METGTIPATIDFREANPNIESLAEGRLRVVDANTPLRLAADSVVAVNTLGLFGAVGHTVLQANPRAPEPPLDPSQHLPRLVPVAGRTEESVKEAIAKILAAPFDINYYRLVQDVFSSDIMGFTYRSYAICPPAENDVPAVSKMEKRTVWFVYSGMGSQWAGMGVELMRIPIFAETIGRLHAVLEPKGVDLKKILTETGPEAFDNILKSFVGIAACQIALTNVLTAIGVVPDGIVGHSVGEQACAYVDGGLTEEQAILAAWARGAASNEATLVKGMMAAVGLGYNDVLPRLPPTIDVACHNSSTSCTLSGPANDVELFVKQLSDEGVFARTVDVAGIAYHSRYIQAAAPFLRQHLGSILPEPKRRSSKWVTTSVPLDKRDEDWAKLCSAEYLTNNLLSPVLFEEALQHIPQQAVVIEIAPHGLLQAILKRALPEPVHIPLTKRGQTDADRFLLGAIGKISCASTVPNVAALYPDTEFPVPRGTPSVANLATWHLDDADYRDQYESLREKALTGAEFNCTSPHLSVNGHRLVPMSEILELMWFAALADTDASADKSPISLRNVYFDQVRSLPSPGPETLRAVHMVGVSEVEVIDEQFNSVAHGRAYIMDIEEQAPPLPDMRPAAQEAVTVHKAELYQELTRLGFKYDLKYQNIDSIQMTEDDWVVTATHSGECSGVLESVLQVFLLKALADDHGQRAHLPKTIRRLDMDLTKIIKYSDFVLRLNLATGILAGSGVYCSGLTTEPYSSPHTLHTLQFVPFGKTRSKTPADFLRVAVRGVLEAAGKMSLKLMQLRDGRKTEELARALAAAIGASSTDVQLLTADSEAGPDATHACLLLTSPRTLAEAEAWLAAGRVDAVLVWSDKHLAPRPGVAVMAEQRFGDDWVSVTRRAAPVKDAVVLQLKASTPTPLAVPGASPVVLVWRGLDETAVDAAIAEVDARPYAPRARMVFVPDNAPAFSLSAPLYADQLARGVRVSVLAQDGSCWGCWRTLPLARPLCAALSATKLDDVDLQFLGANPLCSAAGLTGPVDYVGVEGAPAGGGRRVMGVARWLADDRRPQPDPLLRWPVPQGWAPEDAVTVPYVYALAYYSLLVKAQARRGESILVHEGTKAFGQAAIRVAAQLGCSPIYTTVRSAEERETLCRIFPQLDPCHVVVSGNGGSLFEFQIRVLTRKRGVNIVVNSLADRELRATMRCVAVEGRLLHYNREDALASRSVGLWMFTLSAHMYGISGEDLFRGSEEVRAGVAEAVRLGLRDGVVQPIVGAKVFDATLGLTGCENNTKAVIKVNPNSASSSQQCDPTKCYLVFSNDGGDALLLATRLAALGARNIAAAVVSPPNAAAVEQRQRALRRQHAAHLQVHRVPRWDLAAVRRLVDSAGPLHTALVVVKDDADEAVPALVSAALAAAPAVRLVVLSAQPGPQAAALRRLADLAAARASQGLSTACLAAPLASAVGHVVDLVSRAEPPLVTVLTESDAASGPSAAKQPIAVLPDSAAALAAVGRAAARCADGAALRAVPSLSLPSRCPTENSPVFVLPPLGVLDPAAAEQLAGLAGRLLNPVFVVEAAVRASIHGTAKDVVKLIESRQPRGPYNVLGWGLGVVLAVEVQRQLEAAGRLGALFLVNADVGAAMEWAKQAEAARETAAVADPEAQRGSEAVSRLLNAIANYKCDLNRPFEWSVHVVGHSANDQHSFIKRDSNVHLMQMVEPGLDHASLSSYVNENSVNHSFVNYDDMRYAITSNLSAPKS